MKRAHCLIVLVLALCLAGCVYSGPIPETTADSTEPPQSLAVETSVPETEIIEETALSEPEMVEETTVPQTQPPEPEDGDFVRVRDYIPDIFVDLRYATEDNFTGQRIYDFEDAWLRYGTVKKLALAQEKLREYGLYLKIWDAFRPVSAQFRLWEICPDPVYVANPNNGYSSHSRGNTVDVTLVYADGTEAVMPTGFDDFSALADRDYSDCPSDAAENARLLEDVMVSCGFKPYSGEWWHFSDETVYNVEENFAPEP